MPMLLASAVFFVAIHIGIAGTSLRDRVVARLGPKGYAIAFSLASLVGIFWMVNAYQTADYLPTWGMLETWKPIAIVLMLPAFMLVVIGVMTPNPTGVAQESQLNAAPKGIVRITRHPFLMGVGLWALVHLVGNGDWASLVFFGTWALVAFAGPPSIDAKRRRLCDPALWDAFAAKTSIVPFAAIISGRSSLVVRDLLDWRLGAAIVAYALMLGGHSHIIGVSPFPA